MKGDWQTAAKELKVLSAKETSASTRLQVHAELLLMTLKRQQWQQLEKLIVSRDAVASKANQSAQSTWSLAVVHCYLGLAVEARDRGKTQAANDWERRATTIVDERGKKFGPLWMRKVQSRMASILSGSTESSGSASANLQAHAAQGMYRAGKLEEAVTAFDNAAKLANADGDREKAFEFARMAAGILLQNGNRRTAQNRFRTLALKNRSLSKASESHLVAIKLATEKPKPIEKSTDGPNAPSTVTTTDEAREYAGLLDEHLKVWPKSETAQQVYFWRAERARAERRWSDAMQDYLAVRPDVPKAKTAVSLAEFCAKSWLDQAEQGDAAVLRRDQDSIIKTFRQYADALRKSRQTQASSAACDLAALVACQIAVEQRLPAMDLANDLLIRLGQADAGSSQSSDEREWRDRAHGVLVVALAQAAKSKAAIEQLGQIQALTNREWKWILGQLVARKDFDATNVAMKIVNRTSSLEVARGTEWQQLQGKTLVQANRYQEAVVVFNQLIAANAKDGEAHEGLAMALAAGKQWKASIAAYRRVVANTPASRPQWFRAKLGIAQGLVATGDSERAVEMVRLLRALHPEMGGKTLRLEFDRILAVALAGK